MNDKTYRVTEEVQVSFLEHMDDIIKLAIKWHGKERGAKAALCRASGVKPSRISDFYNKSRTFTALYFVSFLNGMGLSVDDFERETGSQLSAEQREASELLPELDKSLKARLEELGA
jgi:hypothetical protein